MPKMSEDNLVNIEGFGDSKYGGYIYIYTREDVI